MMGIGMMRSIQNVAVLTPHRDRDLFSEIVENAVLEAGWERLDDGWLDEDGDKVDDPEDMLFALQLSGALEETIIEQVHGKYGKTHPSVVKVASYETLRGLPFISEDRIPDHYTRVQRWFVDSSGFGEPGEPAMTFNEFQQAVFLELGRADAPLFMAIEQAGQFQVYIHAYRRTADVELSSEHEA